MLAQGFKASGFVHQHQAHAFGQCVHRAHHDAQFGGGGLGRGNEAALTDGLGLPNQLAEGGRDAAQQQTANDAGCGRHDGEPQQHLPNAVPQLGVGVAGLAFQRQGGELLPAVLHVRHTGVGLDRGEAHEPGWDVVETGLGSAFNQDVAVGSDQANHAVVSGIELRGNLQFDGDRILRHLRQ